GVRFGIRRPAAQRVRGESDCGPGLRGQPGHRLSVAPFPRMIVKHWQRRPSALSRQALAVYTVLILYGSLYPFSGWRSLGIGPFADLADPLPQYLTAFDVITNVLGYMPFGALAVLALYPRWRGAIAAGIAFLGGAL